MCNCLPATYPLLTLGRMGCSWGLGEGTPPADGCELSSHDFPGMGQDLVTLAEHPGLRRLQSCSWKGRSPSLPPSGRGWGGTGGAEVQRWEAAFCPRGSYVSLTYTALHLGSSELLFTSGDTGRHTRAPRRTCSSATHRATWHGSCPHPLWQPWEPWQTPRCWHVCPQVRAARRPWGAPRVPTPTWEGPVGCPWTASMGGPSSRWLGPLEPR